MTTDKSYLMSHGRPSLVTTPVFQYGLLLYSFFSIFKANLLRVTPSGVDPTLVLLGILTWMWLISLLHARVGITLPPSGTGIALFFLAFVVLISSYWSPVGLSWAFFRGMRFILQDLPVMIFVLTVPSDDQSVRLILTRTKRFLVFVFFYAAATMVLDPDPIHKGFKIVPYGAPPIAVSYVLALLGVFLFVDFLSGGKRQRVLSIMLLPGLAICLLLINQRGPVYAMILTMAFVGMFIHPGARAKAMALALTLLIAVSLLFMMNTQRFGRFNRLLKGFSGVSASTRLDYWRTSAQIFLEHPLVGGGPGSFVRAIGASEDIDESPHNVALEMLAEYGLLGGVLFLYLLGSFVVEGWLNWARGNRRHDLLILAFLVYMFAQMPFSSRLLGWRFWWLVFGLITLQKASRLPGQARRTGGLSPGDPAAFGGVRL